MYSVTSGCSVSELNQMIAESLRADPRLRSVTVTAEISGFKHHTAHLFSDLRRFNGE